MKIKQILSQHRRDFCAIYVCGYCGFEYEGLGYDDDNFHRNVIPSMECSKCNQRGEPNYCLIGMFYYEGMHDGFQFRN